MHDIKKMKGISGLTVIELGIFVAVFGLFLSIALNEYSQYIKQKAVNDTKARVSLMQKALSAYVGNLGRLPCPADPTLRPEDINAGVERCVSASENVYPANNGGVIRVRGHRDTDGINGKDPVLIGSIPYITLGITYKDTIDGWGSKFTYAVSEIMTDAARYNDDNGVIDKLARHTTLPDNPPLGPGPEDGGLIYSAFATLSDGSEVTRAFLIAIVSHGSDKKGGYNYYGKPNAACDTVTPSLDSENCDNDATFLSAEAGTKVYSIVKGTNYFDDPITVFTISREGEKWSYTSNTSIKNKTAAQVGIGKNPETMLDVNGNIMVGDVSDPNSKYLANEYCSLPEDKNSDGDFDDPGEQQNCFEPKIIAGSGIKCNGGIMTGIADSSVKCVKTIDATNITIGGCPPNEYVIGIDAGGNFICGP